MPRKRKSPPTTRRIAEAGVYLAKRNERAIAKLRRELRQHVEAEAQESATAIGFRLDQADDEEDEIPAEVRRRRRA